MTQSFLHWQLTLSPDVKHYVLNHPVSFLGYWTAVAQANTVSNSILASICKEDSLQETAGLTVYFQDAPGLVQQI